MSSHVPTRKKNGIESASNQQPSIFQANALTTELFHHYKFNRFQYVLNILRMWSQREVPFAKIPIHWCSDGLLQKVTA